MRHFLCGGHSSEKISSRRGYTLAEVLAAMAVSAVIIAAAIVLSAAVGRMNERAVTVSADLYDLRVLRYYAVEHAENLGENSIAVEEGGVINVDTGERIVDGESITEVKIYFEYSENGEGETFAFKRCAVSCSGGTYDFIIGIS